MSGLERLFRLVLLALIFATFWLPVHRGLPYVPLGLAFLMAAAMTLTNEIEPFFPTFPFLIGLPVLFIFNIWLLWRPSRVLKIFYRILLVFVVLVKWYVAVEGEFGWHVVTVLLYAVISIGVLFETVLVLLALLRRRSHQVG